eukprot:2941754-Rhodomonas_salina.1
MLTTGYTGESTMTVVDDTTVALLQPASADKNIAADRILKVTDQDKYRCTPTLAVHSLFCSLHSVWPSLSLVPSYFSLSRSLSLPRHAKTPRAHTAAPHPLSPLSPPLPHALFFSLLSSLQLHTGAGPRDAAAGDVRGGGASDGGGHGRRTRRPYLRVRPDQLRQDLHHPGTRVPFGLPCCARR